MIPKGVTPEPHELISADRLQKLGYDVEFRRLSNVPKRKNPDILLNGESWEMKAPWGAGERTIDNNLREAEKQSRQVILDLARYPRGDEYAIKEVLRRMVVRTKLEKVLIIRKDGSSTIITRSMIE